jgi:hypothetical protein
MNQFWYIAFYLNPTKVVAKSLIILQAVIAKGRGQRAEGRRQKGKD